MAWIESHQSLLRHPKTSLLLGYLQRDRYAVIGHLHALWWWALDLADDAGRLPKGTSDAAIADGAGWPVEDAASFVRALKLSGFMERRGYQLHDWNDYTWRYHNSKELHQGKSQSGTFGNHKRWHEDRGAIAPDCEYCQSATRESSHSESLANRESSLPHLPSSPTDPTESTEATSATRNGTSARGHRLNFTDVEWVQLIALFPGLNVQGLWRDWVIWIEEGGGKREPKNKREAFEGWLRRKEKRVAATA